MIERHTETGYHGIRYGDIHYVESAEGQRLLH